MWSRWRRRIINRPPGSPRIAPWTSSAFIAQNIVKCLFFALWKTFCRLRSLGSIIRYLNNSHTQSPTRVLIPLQSSYWLSGETLLLPLKANKSALYDHQFMDKNEGMVVFSTQKDIMKSVQAWKTIGQPFLARSENLKGHSYGQAEFTAKPPFFPFAASHQFCPMQGFFLEFRNVCTLPCKQRHDQTKKD